MVFADTFYWVALTNSHDSEHSRALAFARSLGREPVATTELVLVEYLNYFAEGGGRLRGKASANVDRMLNAASVKVFPHTAETFRSGLALYKLRPDKGYSLTDCISMEVMRREGMSKALTNDHHFEQEGFCVLFRR